MIMDHLYGFLERTQLGIPAIDKLHSAFLKMELLGMEPSDGTLENMNSVLSWMKKGHTDSGLPFTFDDMDAMAALQVCY